jgi:tetratricopeptide (TPR) repeat protein
VRKIARLVGAVSFVASSFVACALVLAAGVHAQLDGELSPAAATSLDEERAWSEAQQGHHIKARELAEEILRDQERRKRRGERVEESFIAHFVLGFVHHYGEANFARALFHHNKAAALLRARDDDPTDDVPVAQADWRWHARLLRELAFTHGDLEHYEEQLRYMARYSELYEPDFIAERAWPYMKLRRFDDAREAANLGRATGDEGQIEFALNALCAIEFEAGNDQASYDACQEAMMLHGGDPSMQGAVDFTNFAEAARGVFRLDEAERVDLLATEAQVSWYGSPWVELGELYVREGRYVEALNALKQVPAYRERRPPHVRDADRGESRRALAAFFLVIGRADEAVEHGQKAVNAPDRRGHQSRDPAQDRAIHALLYRAALRLRAERRAEESVGAPWYARIGAWGQSTSDRWNAWLAGRVAARNLADEELLVGTFKIGSHESAVMQPWLAGELSEVLGAGVVMEAVRRARREDEREGSDAYYDAFEADAALSAGDTTRARELAQRALAGLQPAEALLRARMLAVMAESARRDGETASSIDSYALAFQADPGIFRRYGWPVPARFEASGGIAEDIADLIEGSDRFVTEDWGLTVRVSGDRARAEACLLDRSGSVLTCAEREASGSGEDEDAFAARVARAFLEAAFAPRVDLSQSDANGLDGSNRLSRDPLRTMFGHEPPPRD